ncbi:MAG: hypothetical protein ACYS7Y_32920 [Planctomycetota bacterium]|jgi:hypothetical protein
MKLKKLKKKVLRQAKREYRRGTMSKAEYDAARNVANDKVALMKLNDRVEREVNPWNRGDGLKGDFRTVLANIWDWFVENWPKILEIIMTIAPLLLLEPRREDS